MSQIKATYIDHMGSDLSVVNAARVSFAKTSEWGEMADGKGFLKDEDRRLIRYLASHEHLSPFGHAFASFHIKAPIFVARQLVKHKFLRWNEVSRRYVDDPPEFYTSDFRLKAENKKQGSGGYVGDPLQEITSMEFDQVQTAAFNAYMNAIEDGVAPEQARMILPQNTMTEWYWSGSLDAFANMCNLRLKDDTQYETRIVAQEIHEIMKTIFPISWDALVV